MADSTTQLMTDSDLSAVTFNDQGLVAAIAQQHDTGEILMMAWMNAESLQLTLESGQVCYWSRSRQALWHKGESSGQVQMMRDLRLDCDGDTILLQVDQTGVACHTGRRNCFYRAFRDGEWVDIAEVETDPNELYGQNELDGK
jgi:phosphoribosyl-AMP cyclohydrolase